MIIDTEKIYDAIKSGTAQSVSERFGLPLSTVNQYRASENSSSYRNWQKMNLETAIKVMTIINKESNLNIKYYTVFFDEKPIEKVDDLNFDGMDLAITLDRSFDSKSEAIQWTESVLKENTWTHFAYLLKVNETDNGAFFDILDSEEYSDNQ